MPPLNTTLIRGCSELQGPATQEWLWHGSHFVAPSLCSLLGPITPHLSFLLSFFLELFWWGPADESPASEPRRGDGRTFSSSCGDGWSVGPTEGMEDAGSGGRPSSRRAGETRWAFTTSWSESSRLLPHHLFSRRLFGGVFLFVLRLAGLTSLWTLGSMDLLQNYVANSQPISSFFFSALHVVCFGMLSPHINNRVP